MTIIQNIPNDFELESYFAFCAESDLTEGYIIAVGTIEGKLPGEMLGLRCQKITEIKAVSREACLI